MDKKNYNIEIFFESQKKSFVMLSKNKITLEDIKSRTIKEFNIPQEYEKDMRFSISINNRPITLLNDHQIMNNFEEMSKNNFYLKINFNINNNNYIFHSPSSNSINKRNNKNKRQKIERGEQFSIISKLSDKSEEIKYIEEIKKLKEENEKLKNERNNKAEFDIRKFDEKFRDLNNKKNDLEQKIIELENENKNFKINRKKNNIDEDNFDDKNDDNDNILIRKIEKIFIKIINEHDKNICKEISDIKNKIDLILNGQNTFNNKNIFNKIENDNNFELLNNKNEIEKILSINKEDEKNDNLNKLYDISDEIVENNNDKINDEHYYDGINLNNTENNSDDLKKQENILINYENNNYIKQKLTVDQDKIKEDNTYINPKIKRNINFYEEEENEKNSKSFDASSKLKTKLKLNSQEVNNFKDLKDNFIENRNQNMNYLFEKTGKNATEKYARYIIPNKLKIPDKIKTKKKKKAIIYNSYNTNNNFHNSKRPSSLTEEDLINYETNSEFNSEIKDVKEIRTNKRTNSNLMLKKEKIRNINKINNYNLNKTNETPSPGMFTTDIKKLSSSDKDEKYSSFTTPNIKEHNIKESIDDYFINVFQSIFFYGNNGYVNMLNISDKLNQKLKDGLDIYRNNMKEVKDSTLKYITYSIIPIINDTNTKEYQRKMLKEKIKLILEYMKIDTNYFENEYKDIKENKFEKKLEKRNINGINITHSKINEFRKYYQLKEENYPDEMLIKALIRYRGNKEMAFQYLFS